IMKTERTSRGGRRRVPNERTSHMALYSRIVVPLDGSELAQKALEEARDLAGQLDIPLPLIRVVDTYRTQAVPATGMALDYSLLAELAEEELEDAKAYMKE